MDMVPAVRYTFNRQAWISQTGISWTQYTVPEYAGKLTDTVMNPGYSYGSRILSFIRSTGFLLSGKNPIDSHG